MQPINVIFLGGQRDGASAGQREGTQICCHIIVSCPDVHVPRQRMSGGLIYISCPSGMYIFETFYCARNPIIEAGHSFLYYLLFSPTFNPVLL